MTNLDKLRESFEAWITETQPAFVNGWSPKLVFKRIGGEYQNSFVKHSWLSFHAAHISAVKQCAEMCEAVIECYRIKACCSGEVVDFEESIPECKSLILALLPKDNKEVNK